MVLKTLSFILGLGTILLFQTQEPQLLDQYERKIRKVLQNRHGIATEALQFDRFRGSGSETYTVKNGKTEEGYLFLKEVRSCSLNGCASSVDKSLNAEYFDIAIFLSKEHSIRQILILDYFSDYGYQIASRRYLKRYIGHQIGDFSRENTLVDGVSGATVSYNALQASIRAFARELYRK